VLAMQGRDASPLKAERVATGKRRARRLSGCGFAADGADGERKLEATWNM